MNETKLGKALVTGASSGLGRELARLLAEQGCDLVVVARRRERLEELAGELRNAHGVAVEVIAFDLSAEAAGERLYEAIKQAGHTVDILVNNAGFGIYGDFLEGSVSRLHEMLNLNVTTLTILTRLYGEDMRRRGCGYILQVASIGAFQPVQLYASYSATKSYVLSFGEAIHHELKGSGVSVTTLNPGVTKTEFLEVAAHKSNAMIDWIGMDARTVAAAGLAAMFKGKRSCTPGLINKISYAAARLSPKSVLIPMAARFMK
ncbi:MAG: SDR family oxidoreductase [Candidatus Schekmanbacteria bacterium]|nr:SDR family oxidoreductase [Candidatus Schekmanbacteria bacterium]